MLIAALTIACVFAFADLFDPDPLRLAQLDGEEHIRVALNPEKLAPPQALPPGVFVVAERPELQNADRDWNKLDPLFMQQMLQLFARMEKRGYALALLEGYRSPGRQTALATGSRVVTAVPAFKSKHQYGLAADVAPVQNGRLVLSVGDTWSIDAYRALGEEAAALGLAWGGRWVMKDYGHIEAAASIEAHLKRN